jgi:hypothetical protein
VFKGAHAHSHSLLLINVYGALDELDAQVECWSPLTSFDVSAVEDATIPKNPCYLMRQR